MDYAENLDHSVANCLCIERKPTAMVNLKGFSREVQAMINSVQPVIKLMSTV